MIVLPRIDNVPPAFGTAGMDLQAARCALQLVDRFPVPPARKRGYLEQRALRAMLEAWLEPLCAGFTVLYPTVKVFTRRHYIDEAAEEKKTGIEIHVGNRDWEYWQSQWGLEGRWLELERRVPGLAATALAGLEQAGRCSLHVYTPNIAHYHAAMLYGWDMEEDHGDDDRLSEKDFDAVIPPAVRKAKPMRAPQLAALAGRHDDVGLLARKLVQLREATTRAWRRKDRVLTEHQDMDGPECIGWAVTLRWNYDDPLPQIYDDYGQLASQSEGAYESFFYSRIQPDQVAAWMQDMESRLAIARLVDAIVPLVATRMPR